MSTPASPATHAGPDVYVLPLTEVSLPVAKQPGRSVQLLRSTDLGHHSLLYIKEIGHGWFGKILLGEVHSGLRSTQVVVKELKSSASVQDQMHFLEEARPFRSLQHPALVQCLAQCTEVTPYLVVMEFCPLGDVKGYLRSCRATDSVTPDPLLLQRMACEITSGLLHLHKNNFIHSDLALRNCLLTADINVKIGDYGLSHNKYKDDYFVTSDQTWIPLRWIAPELVDEVHGNLLVVDQTKESNIWSLGVTIWELFELGNQPYRHYSDRQVLSYAVKDQQLKLPKPLLKYSLADRWYEVMQFCWLQPDQRPTAEEVHLLLSYLCAKGASEAEEDFERRWNSMRPNTSHANLHGAGALAIDMPMSSTTSSFPLLEQFPTGDGYHSESGDDILTVTETSHGLNFEYKWEQARAEQHYHSSSTTGTLGQGNPHCQQVFYPPGGIVGGCAVEGLALGVSPSYYEPKQLQTPVVVPVLSAHSPSVSNEYYIRIEEPIQSNIDMNFTMCAYSPEFGGSNGSFLTGSGDSGECLNCPPETKPDMYWSAEVHKCSAYDSDISPAISLTMEPLLGHGSPIRPWESGHYVSYKDRDGGYYYEPSPPKRMDHYLIGDSVEPPQESWGSRSLRQALGELEDPLGVSPSVSSAPQDYSDPYLENIQGAIIGENVAGGYYDMMGSLRKTMPGNHSVCIDVESGGAIFVGRDDSDSEEEDIFVERRGRSWSANKPANNPRVLCQRQGSCVQDSYADFHYTMPMTDVEDTWPEEQSMPYHMAKPIDYLEAPVKSNTCLVHGRHISSNPSPECSSYLHMCHEPREAEVYPVPCCQALSSSHFVDPLTGTLVRNCFMIDCVPGKSIGLPKKDQHIGQAALSTGHMVSKIESSREGVKQFDISEQYVDIAIGGAISKQEKALIQDIPVVQANPTTEAVTVMPHLEKTPAEFPSFEPESEMSKTVDSGVDHGRSSISLVEIDDCSDDDITDVTSGIFADFTVEIESVDYTTPAFKSLQKQVGTPDSMDSIDIPSTACSSETLSPASIHPSSSPKTVDSGYDTENNESPEFVLKEPHEDSKALIQPLGKVTSGTTFVNKEQEIEQAEQMEGDVDVVIGMTASESSDGELKALSDKTPYRDSAYFSDYDAGKDKESEEDINEFEDQKEEEIINTKELLTQQETDAEENLLSATKDNEKPPKQTEDLTSTVLPNVDESFSACDPAICRVSLSFSENDVSTIKDHVDVEDLGIELDHSAELKPPESQIFDSNASHRPSANEEEPFKQVVSDEATFDPLTKDDVANTNASIPEVLIAKEKDVLKDLSCNIMSEKEVVKFEPERNNLFDSQEQLESKNEDSEDSEHKRNFTRPCSPPPPLEGRASPTDGEEADEEDGDSEDSDESDEELRTYSIQEQSEESEDEILPVPIIVSDCSDAHKLRSLLKIPNLSSDSLCDDMETKKKVVSFFDDVTVFLFDQESPTRELADHHFPLAGESSKASTVSTVPNPQEKVNISDDSSDGNISEESAGFEWEDDFSLLPLPTSSKDSPPDITTKPSLPTSSSKPVAQVSRFTVSPSSVSRFSITHVSDSDMDSAGGSSEDGEKE